MRLLRFALLLIGAALCFGCSETPLAPEPVPSPSPSPVRPSLEELCAVQKITVGLKVNGQTRFVVFLGEVAVFKANITYAGESEVLDPPFDSNDCPEGLIYHWHKSGPAAGAAKEQGNRDEQEYRLVPDGTGDLTVDVSVAGFDNVKGVFDLEVKQN